MNEIKAEDRIDFGETPPAVNEILQEGVSLYRQDPAAADARFREALALDPTALPTYYCLYKIHTDQGALDEALRVARAGLTEAARQAGWPSDWTRWTPALLRDVDGVPGRFALYTLKALSFIHLRREEPAESRRALAKLAELGRLDSVGGAVIADLIEAIDP